MIDNYNGSVRLFISYSRNDKRDFDILKQHLSHLTSNRRICHDMIAREIEEPLIGFKGREYFEGLREQDILLILISRSWISSPNKDILEWQIIDLNERLEKYNIGLMLPIIPIHLKQVEDEFFKDSPIGKYNCFPSNVRAIASFPSNQKDKVFAEIPKKVREAISSLNEIRKKQVEIYSKQIRIYENRTEEILNKSYFPLDETAIGQICDLQQELGLTNDQVYNSFQFLRAKKEDEYSKSKIIVEQEIIKAIYNEYPFPSEMTYSRIASLARSLKIRNEVFQQIWRDNYLVKQSMDESAEAQHGLATENKNNKEIKNALSGTSKFIADSLSPTEIDSDDNYRLFWKPLSGLLIGLLIGSFLFFGPVPSFLATWSTLFPPPRQVPVPGSPGTSPGSVTPLDTSPPTVCPSPIPMREPPGTYSVRGVSSLDVKEGVSPNCSTLFRLSNGTLVEGTGEVTTIDDGERWAKISFNRKQGWVPKRYLSKHVSGKW